MQQLMQDSVLGRLFGNIVLQKPRGDTDLKLPGRKLTALSPAAFGAGIDPPADDRAGTNANGPQIFLAGCRKLFQVFHNPAPIGTIIAKFPLKCKRAAFVACLHS